MNANRVLVTCKETELFDRAVRDNAMAVVTFQEDDGWRTFKCRFLERDANMRFFVLDHVGEEGHTPPPLALGQYVGISFRHASRKILLSTVVEAKGRFICSDNIEVSAIRYRWPKAVTELQRRAFYRTPVPPNLTLVAHLWAGGVAKRATAQAPTSQVHSGCLLDISCGGTFIRLDDGTPPNWGENENLGLELQLGDGRPPILLDGQYRGFRTDEDGKLGIAVRFVGMELSVDGRLTLQRIANGVQRLHRLAMPGMMYKPRP